MKLWDGEEDLYAEDSDTDESVDGQSAMDEDEMLAPPRRVKAIYDKATPLLRQLREHPEEVALLTQLNAFNKQIVEGNKADNANIRNESEQVSEQQWLIPISFFGPHYKIVLGEYAKLLSDPSDATTRERVSVEKQIIDEFVTKNHFPAEWSVLDADSYLQHKRAEIAAEEAKASAAKVTRIQYPWATAEAADGSLIVGVRQQGRWGIQVCVERVEEDGHIIRRHESASEVGLLEVEKYKALNGHKILSEGQSGWSDKDRRDFDEVLWVTKSQIQRKNLAANRKDPPADCCVRFHKKGINILTVSSLGKVLGATSARAQIDKVCRRDGIAPPWQAGWVSQYDDPAKVEKDATRRRAMKDAQAAASSTDSRTTRGRQRRLSVQSYESASETKGTRDNDIQSLEVKMADLTKTVSSLAEIFAQFMKTAASTNSSG